MGLSSLGTLPVSALNIGLAASLPFLESKILDLQLSISGLQVALGLQLQIGINLPTVTLPSIEAGIAVQLANLGTLLDPLSWVTLGASINLSLSLQLGLVEISLAAALQLQATFQAGLSAGSLSMWSYSGRAVGFGTALASHTANGWGAVGPNENVQAIVIATESPASWGSFGFGFSVGSSAKAAANPPPPSPVGPPARLVFEGVLGGGQLNTGVLSVKKALDLFVLKLQGLAAGIRAQVQVSLGLNLPPIGSLQTGLKATPPSVLLNNLLTVKLDLAASISALQLQISVVLTLIADITASLSAGGLTVWAYNGPSAGLGDGLRAATAGGLPGGSGPEAPAYGVVVASQFPAAMAAFGGIFKAA